MISRRTLFKTSSAALLGALTHPVKSFATEGAPMPEVSLFTKHFVGLEYNRLADVVAGLGVTGIEAPIRPGGHVEPRVVEEELPKLVEALKKSGVRITMLTSGINEVSTAARTEVVLRTAKALGIPRYRMNWYTYDHTKPIWSQVDEIRPRLKDLVALSKEVGILPCYQNHSGAKYVGAGIWDMALLMRDYLVSELAWAFDIMHATIEGSDSWPTEVALVRDRIGMAFFKDFQWSGAGHKPAPLGEGNVHKTYVGMLKQGAFSGPVCLHIEHLKGGMKDEGYMDAAVAATRRDLGVLAAWWA